MQILIQKLPAIFHALCVILTPSTDYWLTNPDELSYENSVQFPRKIYIPKRRLMLTLCAHWIITRLTSVMLKDRWGHLWTFSTLFPSLWKTFGTFCKSPGAFHLGKITGLTGLNAIGKRGLTGNFNGRPFRSIPLFYPSRLEQTFPFLLHNSVSTGGWGL